MNGCADKPVKMTQDKTKHIKTEKTITELRQKIHQGAVAPFIGAGLSVEAKTGDGNYPPSDKVLLDALIDQMAADSDVCGSTIKDMPRSEQTKTLKAHYGEDLGIHIRRLMSYKRVTPSQHQRILGLLRFNLLLTTNYDTIIEDVIYPRPELYITHNQYRIDYALDEISSQINKRPLLVKLNGCQSQPESIALGTGSAYYDAYWTKPLESIYQWKPELSLLFVGYSFGDTDFINYFRAFREKHQITAANYAIITQQEYDRLIQQPFVTELSLKLIPYNPVENEQNKLEFKGLWEILSQLKTQEKIDLTQGVQTGVFFKKDNRAAYLHHQQQIEQQSSCLRYLTPSPSNAVCPEAYIREFCPAGLRKLYQSLDLNLFASQCSEEEWVARVIENMINRKNTLEKRMWAGAEIRAICLEESVLEDASLDNRYVNMKYDYIIDKIDDKHFDLELRMVKKGDIDKSTISSYALMGSPHAGETDLAIAYATQANKGGFMLHVIERNTKFAHQSLVDFEKLWARSMPEVHTRDYLYELFN